MFDKKTIELYRKLFKNIFILTADFTAKSGNSVYIRIGNTKVKVRLLSDIKTGSQCLAFKDENNNYFIISSIIQDDISSYRNISYRKIRRLKRDNLKYLVKTISFNRNDFWLGGYKRDSLLIENTLNRSSTPYITNAGKDEYKVSVRTNSAPASYIHKTLLKEDFFDSSSNSTEQYLGNGLWESTEEYNRLTIVDDEIFENTVTYENKESPNGDECRKPSGDDFTITVPTWTPENPKSPFKIESKNCGLTWKDDPDLEERNPQGIVTRENQLTYSGYSSGNYGTYSLNNGFANLAYEEFYNPDKDEFSGSSDSLRPSQQIDGGREYVSVITASVKSEFTKIDVDKDFIDIEFKFTVISSSEKVYKKVVSEIRYDENRNTYLYSYRWKLIYNSTARNYAVEDEFGTPHINLWDYTQKYTVRRSDRGRISPLTTEHERDGTIVEDNFGNYPDNIGYYHTIYTPTTISGEDYRGKFYQDFLNGQYGNFNIGNPSSNPPNSGDLTVSYQSSTSLDPYELSYYTIDGGTQVLSIPRPDETSSTTYTFTEFERYSECELKGRVVTETTCENYSGTFLAQRTSDGFIYQTVSGSKRYKYSYETNESTITENPSTNRLTLKYSGKTINLDTSNFLRVKQGNYSVLSSLNKNSTALNLSINLPNNDEPIDNINFAIGSKYLFNRIVDGIPCLIQGTVTSATGTNNNFTINASITSFSENKKASFLNTFVLDNGSFFNYLFRLGNGFSALTDKERKKIILNPFLLNIYYQAERLGINFFKYTSIGRNLVNDNIVKNKIYSVVEIISKKAIIEEWSIEDSGKTYFTKIFKTPYYPLNRSSSARSHSYHPKA